jgi:hypothetical protein
MTPIMLETIMMSNTEIVVHDDGNRLASSMYYEGDLINKIIIGRDMGWGALSSILIKGATTLSSSLNVIGNIIGSGTPLTN